MGRNQEALTLLNAATACSAGSTHASTSCTSAARCPSSKPPISRGARVGAVDRVHGQLHLRSLRTRGAACDGGRPGPRLDDTSQTTIRLGAYLHDLGKVRVPHEILKQARPAHADEFAVVQLHPIWGLELLAAVEFPWDLKRSSAGITSATTARVTPTACGGTRSRSRRRSWGS